MKNRKQNYLSDAVLSDLFREFCHNDEDCNKAVRDANKAFMMLKSDKVFRNQNRKEEQL